MSHEATIHPIQTTILRHLLFVPHARFAQLQKIAQIESDQLKFHTKRLLELDYIEKIVDGSYQLTNKGKEYANKLDTDNNEIERQPKTAVILVIENQKGELLLQERLKHPYFGYVGFPGGKIRWGETIMEAAARELMEEAGLRATLLYRGIYHEQVKTLDGAQLEDKIFHVIYGIDPDGTLIASFEGGKNEWASEADIVSKDKLYKSFAIELSARSGDIGLIEKTQIYDSSEF